MEIRGKNFGLPDGWDLTDRTLQTNAKNCLQVLFAFDLVQ